MRSCQNGHKRERNAMARIRHIALTTENPSQTAEFYKQAFGLKELRPQP
jgi:catechol-2,3-dioxygenase